MTDKDLKARLRSARLRPLVGSVGWKGGFWIGLIAAGIAAVVWIQVVTNTAPTLTKSYVYGTIENGFVPQSDRSGAATRINVKLDDDRKVALELARGAPYLPGARVKLAVLQKESNGVRWLDYEFVAYEQPPQ